MTAALDVLAIDPAYLDAPWIEHVGRRDFLLQMNPACWEDACHDCPGLGCLCACHDDQPARPPLAIAPVAIAPPERCRACGYLPGTIGHDITCGQPAPCTACAHPACDGGTDCTLRTGLRIMRMADILRRAT